MSTAAEFLQARHAESESSPRVGAERRLLALYERAGEHYTKLLVAGDVSDEGREAISRAFAVESALYGAVLVVASGYRPHPDWTDGMSEELSRLP